MSNTFSIITPSLNQGDYLFETIQSVQGQNYPLLEHIIIDGGSKDNTQKILSQQPSITWYEEIEKNQSESINMGWRIAKGDFLGWLNSDDIYEPDILFLVEKYFRFHSDVDIIYGNCDYVDEAGRVLGTYPTVPYDYAKLVRLAINYIPQPATFIRRRVLESVGFLDETLHYVMDYDYWLRAGLQHNIAYIPLKLAKMRLHGNAKSVKNLEDFSEELITIYTKLFNSVDLPHAVRKSEKEAMHHAYYRAAHISFWAQNLKRSFVYAFMALCYSPFHLRALLLLMLANKNGFQVAKSFISNPYLLGLDSK